MSALRKSLDDYLSVRRALGAKLDRAEKLLGQFITYLEQQQALTVTIEHAVAWATLPRRTGWWHAMRLSAVRRFTIYLRNIDGRTQIPPPGMIAHGRHRATPYLYSEAEVQSLLQAAAKLSNEIYAATYPLLIGLLAVTGMRISEAIALTVNDFDNGTETLTVRNSKFGKSRLLPLHESTANGIRRYLARRSQWIVKYRLIDSGALLISDTANHLSHSQAQKVWQRLRTQAGLQPRSGHCRPRIHDLRHSFAVATLLDAYRRGDDVAALIPRLSTYLGHADPKHTFWYYSDSRVIPMPAPSCA